MNIVYEIYFLSLPVIKKLLLRSNLVQRDEVWLIPDKTGWKTGIGRSLKKLFQRNNRIWRRGLVCKSSSVGSSHVTFIYSLTLFNVDYKTLAAYALIKIYYPPPIKSIIKM